MTEQYLYRGRMIARVAENAHSLFHRMQQPRHPVDSIQERKRYLFEVTILEQGKHSCESPRPISSSLGLPIMSKNMFSITFTLLSIPAVAR